MPQTTHWFDMNAEEQALFVKRIERTEHMLLRMAEQRGFADLTKTINDHQGEAPRERLWPIYETLSDIWFEFEMAGIEVQLAPWEMRACQMVDELSEAIVYTPDELASLYKEIAAIPDDAGDHPPYYDDKGQWENHQIEMMGPSIKRDEDIYGWPDGFRGE